MNHEKNTILNRESSQKSFLILSMVLFCLSQSAWSQTPSFSSFFPSLNLKEPIKVNADQFHWNTKRTQIILEKGVHIQQGQWSLSCQSLQIHFDPKNKPLSLKAHTNITFVIPLNDSLITLKTDQLNYQHSHGQLILPSRFEFRWNTQKIKGSSALLELRENTLKIIDFKGSFDLQYWFSDFSFGKERNPSLKTLNKH